MSENKLSTFIDFEGFKPESAEGQASFGMDTTVVLSEKGWQQLIEIIDRPPKVNEALKKAAGNRQAKYQRRRNYVGG